MSNPDGGEAWRLGGRFLLEQELGAGGMATVYLGRDEVLDRPVAVKVLKPGFNEDIAARFGREGRTAARLSHLNIVQVFDAGETEFEGRRAPYIVMEHVPGGDLKRLIDSEGVLGAERVAGIGAGVSAGLAHAHGRGVIHRDIKPHNILLDGSGAPKLTDFGIARALDATGATEMTVSGVYLGTVSYSAPEQLRGAGITPKSDVYSLGVALYQAVAGEPPFSGSSPEVASQHASAEPESPGSKRVSGEPDPELDGLILSCLAKDPEHRPDASEAHDRLSSMVSASIAPVLSNVPDARPPRGPVVSGGAVNRAKRRKPVLRTFAGAAALVLVLTVAAAFAVMSGGASPEISGSSGNSGELVGSGEPANSGEVRERQGRPAGNAPDAAGSEAGVQAEAPDEARDVRRGEPEPPAGGAGPEESGGAGPEEAAARTVQEVYRLAASGDYAASYGLLSSGFRQRVAGSQQNWAGTFDTLEDISFVEGPTASVSGGTARVTGTTRAVHPDRTEINRGAWSLVRESGEWRLVGLSVREIRRT